MTQVDRVYSTPPRNTSAFPADSTRRHLLTIAAGAAVAAAIPAAALAAAPMVDPIYAAIDAHRQAIAAHDAVTDVRAAFNDINRFHRLVGAAVARGASVWLPYSEPSTCQTIASTRITSMA
jgi:hypothetical protein